MQMFNAKIHTKRGSNSQHFEIFAPKQVVFVPTLMAVPEASIIKKVMARKWLQLYLPIALEGQGFKRDNFTPFVRLKSSSGCLTFLLLLSISFRSDIMFPLVAFCKDESLIEGYPTFCSLQVPLISFTNLFTVLVKQNHMSL